MGLPEQSRRKTGGGPGPSRSGGSGAGGTGGGDVPRPLENDPRFKPRPSGPPAPLVLPPPDEPLVIPPPEEEKEVMATPARRSRRKLREPPAWTAGLDGALVVYEEYPNPTTFRVYSNWQITCKLGHPGCHKTKGMCPSSTQTHRVIEPLALLHCWYHKAWVPTDATPSHPNNAVTQEEIDAFVADRRQELKSLVARVVP